MTTKTYPNITSDYRSDPEKWASEMTDWVKEATRNREEDIGDFNTLNDTYMRGRKVGKIPANSEDVSASDRVGDFNYDEDYYYILVETTPNTVRWARWDVSTANPWISPLYTVTAADIDSETATDGQVLTADGSGGAAWGNIITNGTYTPTVTGSTNVDSISAGIAQYMRIGITVHVFGTLEINKTSAASTVFRVSLPIASDFDANDDLSGLVICRGSVVESGGAFASTSEDLAVFSFISADGNQRNYNFSMMYQIK